MGGLQGDRRTDRVAGETAWCSALREIAVRSGRAALSASACDLRGQLRPEHPEVAICLNNLAELLRVTNRPAEAEPLIRRALAIDEASLGLDHPNVAIRLNNFAILLRTTGRLAEAEGLFRRALAIDEASFGPDHPTVATRLSNLAALLQATNRLAEAEPLMRRALVIGEASFGPDHPTVAIYLNISPHCWQPLTGWSRRNP